MIDLVAPERLHTDVVADGIDMPSAKHADDACKEPRLRKSVHASPLAADDRRRSSFVNIEADQIDARELGREEVQEISRRPSLRGLGVGLNKIR